MSRALRLLGGLLLALGVLLVLPGAAVVGLGLRLLGWPPAPAVDPVAVPPPTPIPPRPVTGPQWWASVGRWEDKRQ